ncbi:WGxxGxxG-CTERM domain-containing protein [Halomonas sp. ISL-60]|nr:WGxxGxxG-CTERM domain-containing protein [Halomonas sp. ISL-60]
MKKRITTVLLTVLLVVAFAIPASAQNAKQNSTAVHDNNTFYNNDANQASYRTNNVRTNATDNDNDMDWGWLGLLGLLGLVGMRKRVSDRDHANR